MREVTTVEPAVAFQPVAATRRLPRLPLAMFVVLCAMALARNRAVVQGLDWPGVDIQYREMAAAQTLLDDGFGPDSSYQGEHLWYNPVPAALLAIGSRVTGVPLPTFIVRAGPWLNLLAPIALFWLVAALVDSWSAVAATAAFLFMTGTNLPFYYSATYSPWFAPENVGQALFYVTLVPLSRLFSSPASAWRDAGLGALLGVTFLCHTAPALMLGGMFVVLTMLDIVERGAVRPEAWRVVRVLGVALVVSAPFLAQIVGFYHLRVVNTYPSLSPSGILDPNELPALAAKLVRLPVIVAAMYAMVLAARRSRADVLLLAWIGVACGFLGYHFVRVLGQHAGLTLPSIVPPFHFLFYSMAWVSIAFGMALRDAVDRLGRARGWRPDAVMVGAIVGLVAIHLPSYLRRDDFTVLREKARETAERLPVAGYEWIRRQTTSADVFLCTDEASLFFVSPSGRRVVATDRYFSNPFVDWATRDRDRDAMFHALKIRDFASFDVLAARYRVRYVVVPGTAFDWMNEPDDEAVRPFVTVGELPSERFHKAFQAGDMAIFELREAAHS